MTIWQGSQDWFLLFYGALLFICLIGKARAIIHHPRTWRHNFLQAMVMFGCVWGLALCVRIIADIPHYTDMSSLWVQFVPNVLFVVVLTVYGWCE